jgi:Domain of unknown function (DUF4278)
MKLIYRDTIYDCDPANMETNRPLQRSLESPYKLIYRGKTYWRDPPMITEISVQPLVYELSYRGNTYQVIHNQQGQVIAIA